MNANVSRDRRRFNRRVALVLVAVAALALILLVRGWNAGEDSAVGAAVVNPEVTPSGDAVVPDGLETARLTVKDGKFGARELILQDNQPTILGLVNEDGTAYRFQIDGLIDPTAVAAGGETTIDFTDPDAGVYEGRLLPASGDTALATIRVVVQEPDGSD